MRHFWPTCSTLSAKSKRISFCVNKRALCLSLGFISLLGGVRGGSMMHSAEQQQMRRTSSARAEPVLNYWTKQALVRFAYFYFYLHARINFTLKNRRSRKAKWKRIAVAVVAAFLWHCFGKLMQHHKKYAHTAPAFLGGPTDWINIMWCVFVPLRPHRGCRISIFVTTGPPLARRHQRLTSGRRRIPQNQ